jgi:ferritin
MIDKIASIAMREADHATYNFIMWYVNEQVEEEASAGEILAKANMVGDNTALLYSIDAELGTRVFVNPFPATTTA